MKKWLYLLMAAGLATALWYAAWPRIKWRFVRQQFDVPSSIVWGQYCRTTWRDGKVSRFIAISMVDNGKWRVEVKRDSLKDVVAVYDGTKQFGSRPTTGDAALMEPKHVVADLLRGLNSERLSERAKMGGEPCLVYQKAFTPQFGTTVWIDERTGFPWHMNISAEDHKSESRYSIFKLGFHDRLFFDPSNNGMALFAEFGKNVETLVHSRSD